MIGSDYCKIDVNFELSGEKLKSLVLFYGPLIGNDALAVYEYLVLRGSSAGFGKLNDLLGSLNISADSFQLICDRLNEYRLMKTLNKDDRYVFVLNSPLTMKEFIKDDIFVRNFILKTSGPYYQQLIAGIYEDNRYSDFSDVSKRLDPQTLSSWSADDETYLKARRKADAYDFGTRFNVNTFLKDISTTMLPMKFRTRENMKEVAMLADLYNISYDSMRTYIAKTINKSSESFNLKKLRELCMSYENTYQKVNEDEYDVPCISYLMSLQNGIEATRYDKQIIYNLANKYNLSTPVINVLMKHGLENCDNRLIENYLYPVASDLHRNNIRTAKDAVSFLSRNNAARSSSDSLPVYDTSNNIPVSKQEEEELLKLMGKL